MVQDPRTSPRPHHLRPLNQPRRVNVICVKGWPAFITDDATPTRVTAVEDCWAIEDEWWRDPVQRRYFQVSTEGGALRTLYYDVPSESWYEQRY